MRKEELLDLHDIEERIDPLDSFEDMDVTYSSLKAVAVKSTGGKATAVKERVEEEQAVKSEKEEKPARGEGQTREEEDRAPLAVAAQDEIPLLDADHANGNGHVSRPVTVADTSAATDKETDREGKVEAEHDDHVEKKAEQEEKAEVEHDGHDKSYVAVEVEDASVADALEDTDVTLPTIKAITGRSRKRSAERGKSNLSKLEHVSNLLIPKRPSQKALEERDEPEDVATPATGQVEVEKQEDEEVIESATVQTSMKARDTLQLPAFRLRFVAPKGPDGSVMTQVRSYDNAPHVAAQDENASLGLGRLLPRDRWLIATIIIACIASLTSLWYFYEQHQTVLYGDAYSHMLIARRIFDNLTPGLAQLGGIWLPLPHLAMLPFIWNDYLWHTGMAGSVVSMVCYLIAAIYLFLAARALTKNSPASFVGTLVFLLNPNILYMQTTPMSELVLIATLTAACYYFLLWSQNNQPKYMIMAAGATFLATLSRYDGWVLYIAFLALIVVFGYIRGQRWAQIEGTMVIFGVFGGLGIFLWLLWCGFIFGDPLYFQRSQFAAQSQQRMQMDAHLLFAYHDVYQSIRYYVIDCIDILGPVLFVLALAAIILFVARQIAGKRVKPEALASLTFLVPIAFYMLSLYTGQAELYLPEAVPAYSPLHLFNARYGVIAVAPASFFMAYFVNYLSSETKIRPFMKRAAGTIVRAGIPVLCSLIILAQAVLLVTSRGVVTLQDAQYGVACEPTHQIVAYLAQHYAGGEILEDLYSSKIDSLEPMANINFKNIVYEGSGQIWNAAVRHPEWTVDWVIVNPSDAADYLAKKLDVRSKTFTSNFTLIIREPNGLTLYHRNGLPALPWRAVPLDVYTRFQLCGTYDHLQTNSVSTQFALN